ncbi:MAG: DNA mismatch repair protein MutT [Paracoccus sp. (in: a-proteobacteria)]|nr:DNA mismatch repair protein MutT [Paracoccus sp. (in: a-proteobacteria)]
MTDPQTDPHPAAADPASEANPPKDALREASTILLIRRDLPEAPEGAVLMGMRGARAAFMPSKYVFPGGAVDADDANVPLAALPGAGCVARLRQSPRDGVAADPHALAAAALRELAEETGLLLGEPDPQASQLPPDWAAFAQAGLRPSAAHLFFVFRAITPPGRPRRFDARFFLADAAHIHGDPDDFSRACDELSHLHWVPLSQARALNLPFITEVVLAEVAALIRAAEGAGLRAPDTVPFFDNRGHQPRFEQLA